MSSVESSLFERLSQLLHPFDPAELHGLLCGLLCADTDLEQEQWLYHARKALTDNSELPQSVCDTLSSLREYGIAQLDDPDWSLVLLLPNDSAPLHQRTDALAHWCQGLLYGLGVGEVARGDALSEESREFLDDAADIARVGFESEESNEEDEVAYSEIIEYLRVGLLLIYEDSRHSDTLPPSQIH